MKLTFTCYIAWVYAFNTILPTNISKGVKEFWFDVNAFYCHWGDAGNAGQGFSAHVIAVAAGEVCIIHYPWILYLLILISASACSNW